MSERARAADPSSGISFLTIFCPLPPSWPLLPCSPVLVLAPRALACTLTAPPLFLLLLLLLPPVDCCCCCLISASHLLFPFFLLSSFFSSPLSSRPSASLRLLSYSLSHTHACMHSHVHTHTHTASPPPTPPLAHMPFVGEERERERRANSVRRQLNACSRLV